MVIKSYSIKELRTVYGVTGKVFTAWLKSIEAKLNRTPRQRVLTPAQVQEIVNAFGKPEV